METLLQRASKIKLLATDVDGVLTNGLLYLAENRETFKPFHIQDGLGLKLLRSHDIEVAVITAKNTPLVRERMESLDVKHLYQGYEEKVSALDELSKKLNLEMDQIAYIGDDLPDLPLIKRVGLGIAVANAPNYIKEHAHYTTHLSGGMGAVREVCDLLLTAQNKFAKIIESYASQ